MRDDHDHPTLFALPPPDLGRDVPRRTPVSPKAPTSTILPGSHLDNRRQRRALLESLKEKVAERWKGFMEWSGFEKREIDVEIIPGRKTRVAIPQGAPPKLILFRLFADAKKGTFFTRQVSLWGSLARFDKDLCEDLGLPIGRTTLWRLIYADFVGAYRIAPMTTLVDLDSLLKHIQATKIDGEQSPFWTSEKILRYREWEKITPATLAKMEAGVPDTEDDDDEEEDEGDE